ncbi:RAD50-interacting protein 1 [Trichonephila clavipes]|nr:RAD50-interacting protein 1 [Trichonephila clavipes]
MDSPEMFLDVVEFFNSELGSDLSDAKKIPEIIDKIAKYEEDLEREFNPHNPDLTRVNSFIKTAENAIEKIKDLSEKCEELQMSANSDSDSLKSIKEDFSPKIKELKEAESLYCYFQWILKVEKHNASMEEALKNGPMYPIIHVYIKFKEFWEQLRTSDCKNLVTYIKKTMIYWHDVLREKFGMEFQKVLGSLYWPVSSTNLKMPPNQSGDTLIKFNQLFLALCKIALPDAYIKTQDIKDDVEDTSLLLPLQLMLQPLQKRFIFHFMGKKLTNRLDKPEWYLTQILTWISDHSLFLEQTVEPILQKEKLSRFSARAQIMRGLVHLAITRLKSDLPKLLDDDKLLSHTIDEILLFSQELQNQGYPPSYPNLMQILSSEPCFTRWRSLEHQSALEKMDKFLNLDTAWKSRYQEESDIDDMHVPESAELFITLLLTMTERYCNVTDKDCQVFFLELQLELLDDFRLRLHQLSQCQMQETIQENYCGIMNAIHYITSVLEEWNNLPFFLHLYSYKKRKNACESLLKDSEKHLSSLKKKESRSSINVEELLEVSVFDEIIGFYQHMQNDLLQTMCDRVMLDIKAKSRPYRKEKWFCMPVLEDKKLMEISLSAYPMLEVINCSLHSLQELLAKPLFTKMWQQIAMELNIYIFEEVILQNSFSEGGAAQLHFDMTRNLFPIFGTYTTKPENHFKLIRDSCVLLNLSSAPAMLLRETLKHQEGFDSKSSALEELGVYSLSPSQALIILSQRNHTSL